MQRITEDIKTGQLKQIYLLYGEEAYLVRQYRDRLMEAMLSGGDKMNVNRYEGKGVSVPEIIDMSETLPFFADRRVIILENTELLKSGGEKLAEYLKNPAESSSFIIAEREVDKRSGLFKTIKKYGYAAEFGRQDAKTLQKWVLGILKKENKQISAQTLQFFSGGMRRRYGKYQKRTGKAVVLYAGQGCDHHRGCGGDLCTADTESHF